MLLAATPPTKTARFMSRTKKIQLRLRRLARRASGRLIFAALLALEALIFLLDVDTGAGISYAPFLVVPTALAAWLLGRRAALAEIRRRGRRFV